MSDSSHLDLDNQLCFALYSATNAITRIYRSALHEIGLTYPQYLVLLVMWERGPQTVRSLADALELDSSTLTPLLKRLEAAGWLQRTRDDVDQRVVKIELTAAGVVLRRPVAAIQRNVARRTGLSKDDFFALRDQLRGLSGVLTASGDDAVAEPASKPSGAPTRRR